MAETKHTPGPWKAYNSATVTIQDQPQTTPSHVKRVFLDDQGRRNHQFIADCNLMVPEHVANAHLIAAAPELLEAARSVVAWFDALDSEQWARTGPPNTFAEASANWNLPSEVPPLDIAPLRAALAKAEGRTP